VAIFLSGSFFVDGISAQIAGWIPDAQIQKAVIWGAALVLSLPFLIATYRKLQALAMLLAEVSVNPEFAGAYTSGVRRVISEVIPVDGDCRHHAADLRAQCQHLAAAEPADVRVAGRSRFVVAAVEPLRETAFAPANRLV